MKKREPRFRFQVEAPQDGVQFAWNCPIAGCGHGIRDEPPVDSAGLLAHQQARMQHAAKVHPAAKAARFVRKGLCLRAEGGHKLRSTTLANAEAARLVREQQQGNLGGHRSVNFIRAPPDVLFRGKYGLRLLYCADCRRISTGIKMLAQRKCKLVADGRGTGRKGPQEFQLAKQAERLLRKETSAEKKSELEAFLELVKPLATPEASSSSSSSSTSSGSSSRAATSEQH